MNSLGNHAVVKRDLAAQDGAEPLIFNLRVFIPHIDHLFKVGHRLHIAIDQAFRKAGITIAFPQRDVHIFYPQGQPVQEKESRRGAEGAEGKEV